MSGNVPAIRFAGFTEPWEQRKLGELVSIASGMAPSLFNQGDQPYIKVDDLNHTQRVLTSTQSTVARSSCMAKIPAGSTIFAKRGAAIMTNKTRVTGVSAYMDTNMMALIPEGINGEFLYELIGTIGLSRIADTSTIPQINNKHIEPFIVTIPHSREEQQIVATFFTSLDNLITLHQREFSLPSCGIPVPLVPSKRRESPCMHYRGE